LENSISQEKLTKRTIPKSYPIRGEYFRDQTAIIHSMPFRRLKHKTQVFFTPENDHVCTRIEHVMHVATIAASICKGLNNNGWQLDPDLAFAIGLGHDLGHAPFGHAGEKTLADILGKPNSFIHEINSYRVVEILADYGQGLNLTYAVKDGIICHNGEADEKSLKPTSMIKDLNKIKNRKVIPTTFEGCIARFSDKIAYLGRDIEDGITAGFIQVKDIPIELRKSLGSRNGEIIDTLVKDVIEESKNSDCISFSERNFGLFTQLKKFNYDFIYYHDEINEYKEYGKRIITTLFEYYHSLFKTNGIDFKGYFTSNKKVDKLFGNYLSKMNSVYKNEGYKANTIITDYISGMTDNFALECMKEITIPKPIVFNKIIKLKEV
jgi:dGTPase